MINISNINNNIIWTENYFGIKFRIKSNPSAFTFFDKKTLKELNFYSNPLYKYNAFTTTITSVNVENNVTNLTISYKYNYKENIINSKSDSYYNDYLPTNLITNIWYNDDLIYQNSFNNKFSKYEDEELINFTVPANILNEDVVLKMENSSSYGYNEQEIFNLSQYNQSEIYVDFSNSLISKYYFPVSYNQNNFIYEEMTFIKLFRNKTKFPTEIKPLLLIIYQFPLNQNYLRINSIENGQIFLTGLENENLSFNIDYYQKGKYTLFYVNDKFSYDLENKLTKKGYNNNYYNSNSLIIPWDYVNNYGYITFKVNLTSYVTREVNFYMPLFNKYSLKGSGQDSKYHFIENSNLGFDTDNYQHLYKFTIPFNEYNGVITLKDLERWII